MYPAIIFCVSFLLYAKTIGFDFSYFDDNLIIINNTTLFEGSIDIQKIFTTDAYWNKSGILYRPLQNLSFAIDTQLAGGIHPWIFHSTNVLLFTLLVCSLFFLFRRFNIPDKISFIGTLLFVVHPIFTLSVSWIPARGDLLMALFSILSMLFFIDFVKRRKYYQMLLSALFFVLALFSKETAALLPFAFLLYFFCFQEKPKIEKKHVIFGIILLFGGVLWLFLRSLSINAPGTEFGLRFLLNIPAALSQLVIFPVDFSPMPLFTAVKTVTGSLLLIFLLYLVCRKDEIPKKEKLFYFLWFILLLSPVFLNSNQFPDLDYLEHRFLLPMVGVFTLLLTAFPQKWMNSKITIPILVIGFAALSAVSFTKSNVYKNPEIFYGTAIKYDKGRAIAYNNRGVYRRDINNIQGALDDFSYSIFYNNGNRANKAFFNRGVIKFNMGDLTGALSDFDDAIKLDNANVEAYANRAGIKFSMGNFYDALDDVNTALKIKPNNVTVYYNRALLYRELGDIEKALQDCNRILKIDPRNRWAIQLKNILLTEQQQE